jgi:asparagine N-glycosylation enzyme membrane subunit Stt3
LITNGNLVSRETIDRLTGKEKKMGTILIVILVLVLVGALPTWPHSKNWGYYPSGGLGLVLLILIILLLTGRI